MNNNNESSSSSELLGNENEQLRRLSTASSNSSHWAASLGVSNETKSASVTFQTPSITDSRKGSMDASATQQQQQVAAGVGDAANKGDEEVTSTTSSGGVLSDRRLASMLQLFCDVSVDATFVISDRGEIITLNQPALSMFGYSRWELIDRNVNVLMEPKHAKHHDEYLARYRRTLTKRIIGEERDNLHGMKKDGTLFRIVLKVHEYFDGHQRVFLGIIRDMTQLSQIDEFADLLIKFVPPAFKERLIHGENYIGDKYRATIGFVELIEFTERIATQHASTLISALAEIWAAFDAALEMFQCKRVKTSGNCYVFVTKLTPMITAHAINGALMAKHCVDVIKTVEHSLHKKLRGILMEQVPLQVRAAVATGELIAGIVPGVRISFDVWGTCIGLAERLKHVATPNTVVCCEQTHREASYHLSFAAARILDEQVKFYELQDVIESYKGGGIPITKSARFGLIETSKGK